MKILRLVALILLVPSLGWADDKDGNMQVVSAAINEAIRPGFTQYADQTAGLVPQLNDLCEAPNETNLAAARDGFSDALAAWSSVEFFRFGPMAVENRFERTLFWPDPKGIGLKQIQRLLAEEDQTATTSESLAGKSVAVQGMGALEFVLFGTGSEDLATGGSPFRCDYGRAIAGNLDTIAQELASDWAADLPILTPGPENAAYRNADESLLEIVQTLSTGFEVVGQYKLRPVLGETIEKVRPRRAVFRRSEMTQRVLQGNIAGLQSLLNAADFASLLGALDRDPRILGSVEFEIANAEQTLDGITDPIQQVVETEEGWGKLNLLAITMSSVNRTIGERLSAELGLVLGFNSFDGD
ncbi:MAG: imelysin family protein [Pseudomonadota bacterium]